MRGSTRDKKLTICGQSNSHPRMAFKLFMLAIVAAVVEGQKPTDGMCVVDRNHTIRTFKDLAEFEGNHKSFLVGDSDYLGSTVEFLVDKIPILDKNAFTAYNSDFIMGLNLSSKGIKSVSEDAFLTLFCCKKIDLSHNLIPKISMEVFNGLDHLNSLDLSFNDLTRIENQTFLLVGTTLTKLDLSYNRLVYITIQGFEGMTAMEVLDLSHNRLMMTSLKVFPNLTALVALDISFNQIKFLDDTVAGFKNLKVLDISGNKFKGEPPYLTLMRLEIMDISHNNITKLNITNLKHGYPLLFSLRMGNNYWDCDYLNNIMKELIKHGISAEAVHRCSPLTSPPPVQKHVSVTLIVMLVTTVIILSTVSVLFYLKPTWRFIVRERVVELYERFRSSGRSGDFTLLETE